MSRPEFEAISDELVELIVTNKLFDPSAWCELTKTELVQSWIAHYMFADGDEDILRHELNKKIASKIKDKTIDRESDYVLLNLHDPEICAKHGINLATDVAFRIVSNTGPSEYETNKAVIVFLGAQGMNAELLFLSDKV